MNEIGWIEKEFGILDHVPLGMFIIRRDLVVLFWNRCLEDWTGIHRNKIVGTNITTHFPHLSNLNYSTRLNDIFEGGPPTIFSSQLHNYIIPSLFSNGKFRIQHTYVTPVQASDGFYALFAIQDVTDLTQRIQDCRTMRDQVWEEIKERKRIEEELRRTHEDLELRVKNFTTDLISLNEQLQKQIAARKQAEDAMRESEEKYRTIFENTGTATTIIDEDMTISLINREFAKLSGYSREEIENRKILEEFVAKDDIDRIKEYHRLRRIDPDTTPMNYEVKFIDKYGNLKDIFATVQMFPGTMKSLVSLLDITDRKKMENELLHVQKLESIGILARGIAHDFNNLLTAILGNISLAKIYVMEKEVYTHLIEVEKASLRAKDLTQQLLTFSRGSAPVKKTTSIADITKDSANFALRGSNVKCNFFISPDLWRAEVDEGQISQVINNLIINAQQAMPNGGTIEIKCDNVTINAESVLPLKAGNYVKISIKDTGIGIPQENIQKIFDPFFATKPNGSGFGLSISYSLVKNHNGHISVESRSGAGTTFYIYLPASLKRFSVKKEEDRLITGHGKILLMDDEETVRMVTGKMLRHLGYEVEFAKDGEDAIRLYKSAKKSGRPFDAVIMDLTVPGGMGGKEAIIKLNEIEPSVKAIVASGYSNDPVMAEFNKYGFCGIVSKPFTIVELSQALYKIFVSMCKQKDKFSYQDKF